MTVTTPFSLLDERVRAIPAAETRTVPALIARLRPLARNPHELARAIFSWIAHHVDYDVAQLRRPERRFVPAEEVLQRRIAVCSGYSELFHRLAAAGGLESCIIPGWSRGAGLTPGAGVAREADHAWNGVRLQGRWHLLDCTWGAGHLNEAGRFARHFTDHYFLTAPDRFIYDHLPEDTSWQLLPRPLDRGAFEALPLLKPGFFALGMTLQTPIYGPLAAGDASELCLEAPPEVMVLAELRDARSRVCEERTFLQREAGRWMVRAAFPGPGDYVLRLYGKPRRESGPAPWVADVAVRARFDGRPRPAFARILGTFPERDAVLVSPLAGTLQAGGPLRFELEVPGACDVVVAQGRDFKPLERAGQRFRGSLKLRPGEASVCARWDARSNEYHVLLQYQVTDQR